MTKDILKAQKEKNHPKPTTKPNKKQSAQYFSFFCLSSSFQDSCTALWSKGKKMEHCKASQQCLLDKKTNTLRKYSSFSSFQGY